MVSDRQAGNYSLFLTQFGEEIARMERVGWHEQIVPAEVSLPPMPFLSCFLHPGDSVEHNRGGL